MTILDEAMKAHIASIVFCEKRPFSYLDFLQFEVDGVEYHMCHGTFRNKISGLKKKGITEVAYRSLQTFYTLKNQKFGKPITIAHAGVSRSSPTNSFRLLLENLALARNSIHDIRLKFKVDGLWALASGNPSFHLNCISKDICIGAWKIRDLFIKIIIHKTDTVTVSVACSYMPIVLEFSGLILLSNALTRVEERISAMIDSILLSRNNRSIIRVPDHKSWIVTMWHFGADSITEHSGRDFHVCWELAESALIRVYTKDMEDSKRRIRIERQEYPDEPLFKALENKLNLRER